MNKADERLLREKIMAVVRMQDNVTHMNEQGPEYEAVTKELVAERDQLINCVVGLVGRMARDAENAKYDATKALEEIRNIQDKLYDMYEIRGQLYCVSWANDAKALKALEEKFK